MRFEDWILEQPKEVQPNLFRFVAHNLSLVKGHNGGVFYSVDYSGELNRYHVRVQDFEDECKKRKVLASYPLANNNLENRWSCNPGGLQWDESNRPNENDNGI